MRHFLITIAVSGFGKTDYDRYLIHLTKFPEYDKVRELVKEQKPHARHGDVISITELTDQDVIDYNMPEYG